MRIDETGERLMNDNSLLAKTCLTFIAFVALVSCTSNQSVAQARQVGDEVTTTDSVAQSDTLGEPIILLSEAELQELVGSIALYPDDLLAIVLPASTYPLQIVLAARFLDQLQADSTLEPDSTWDESVVALLNYPEVVHMLNDNIEWTWQLGDAVVFQETEVLNAISAFRDLAYESGNLSSDEYQNVVNEEETIVITQVNKEVIYVPYYEPAEVIVYQSRPVYHYYTTAYPVYYYPYSYGYRFSSGFFWGVTTAFTLGWSDYHLHVYHPSYYRHPYYGRSYDTRHHYRRSDIRAFNRSYVDNHRRVSRDRGRDGSYWRPQRNSGARPNDFRNRRVASSSNAGRAFTDNRRNDGGLSGGSGAQRERRNGEFVRNSNGDRDQLFRNSDRTRANRAQRGATGGTSTGNRAGANTATANRASGQDNQPNSGANRARNREDQNSAAGNRARTNRAAFAGNRTTANRSPSAANRNAAANNRTRISRDETAGNRTPINQNSATATRNRTRGNSDSVARNTTQPRAGANGAGRNQNRDRSNTNAGARTGNQGRAGANTAAANQGSNRSIPSISTPTDRRQLNNISSRIRNDVNANFSRSSSERLRTSGSANSNRRQQGTATQAAPRSRVTPNQSRAPASVNRSARAAPTQSRSRAAAQAPTRQRAAPQPRRAESSSRSERRSSSPAPARSARAPSRSDNRSSAARSSGGNRSSAGGGRGNSGRRVR